MTDPDELNYPTVLLRHDLPDGTWHIDWLLGQDIEGSQPLIAFRLPRSLDEVAEGAILPARRIPDHRPLYLDYEGVVSSNRGCVTRLHRGFILQWEQEHDAWTVVVKWIDSTDVTRQSLSIAPCGGCGDSPGGDEWEIRITSSSKHTV